MELRHLRCFVAVAEELHFARAAERLHIEQSPLSRAIKELEYDLHVRLFERTTRHTRLTWAGQVLLDDVRRIFVAVDQARTNVKAAATGFHGALRIAISDFFAPPRLAALLARCRAEEPDVQIRLFQVPDCQQIRGLEADLYDAGISRTCEVGEGMIAEPVWTDPLVTVVPARHPLLAHKRVTLDALLNFPLILCRSDHCLGTSCQVNRLLRAAGREPQIAEYVVTQDLLLTLVAAGYGVGLTCADKIDSSRHPDLVTRPLADDKMVLTTYLLRSEGEVSNQLQHFIERVRLSASVGVHSNQ